MGVLGCGYNYPDVILFSNTSKCVGLDMIGAFYRDGVIRTFTDIRNREKRSIVEALLTAIFLKYRCYRYYLYLSIEYLRYQLNMKNTSCYYIMAIKCLLK